MTIRAAARLAGMSAEGWNKVIKTGRGREETFIAMARVVGAEREVRLALGLAAVSDAHVFDDELAALEAELGVDLAGLDPSVRRTWLAFALALLRSAERGREERHTA